MPHGPFPPGKSSNQNSKLKTHYMARWKMRGGETLAFGETVSATVTG